MIARIQPSYLLVGFLALLLAGFLVLAGGWNMLGGSLWAFSFLSFVPILLRLALAGLVVIAAVIAIFFPERSNEDWSTRLRALPIWPIAIVGGLFFWLLRERTYHGDALLKLKLLATTGLSDDPYVWKEPLDSLLAHTSAGIVSTIGHMHPDPIRHTGRRCKFNIWFFVQIHVHYTVDETVVIHKPQIQIRTGVVAGSFNSVKLAGLQNSERHVNRIAANRDGKT